MLVEKRRVTLHAELMCTEDMVHVVLIKELVHDARTKCITSSSMRPIIVGFYAIKNNRTWVILQNLLFLDLDLTIPGLPLGLREESLKW